MRDLKDLPVLTSSGVTGDGYDYLLSRGVPADRLDTLIPLFDLRYDEQDRRVVFPVREGDVDLGYTARAIDAKQRKRWLSHPVAGGHNVVIYEPDRVLAGGDTLFVVEGPFDALMVTAAMQPSNGSVATAFFGSLPTSEQLAYVMNAIPLYRMVYIMLDANVYGRCRRLAQDLAKATGAPNVGSIHIGGENRDPGATRFAELEALASKRCVFSARNVELDAIKPPTGFNLGGSFRDGEPNRLITRTALSYGPSETFRVSGERHGLEAAAGGRATASSRDRGRLSAARKALQELAIETKTPPGLSGGVSR